MVGDGIPRELAELLEAQEGGARERAWAILLDRYHPLLMKAARRFGRDYDGRMDRYSFIVQGLRDDDFARLRHYRSRPESSFTSWLLVVARRLCVDYQRTTYGRGGRAADSGASERHRAVRRLLVELTGVSLDTELLPASDIDPEVRIRREELHGALAATLRELDPRDRLLLKLRFEDGRSVREIAEIMRFPSVFHVYRRLKSALEACRRGLRARGINEPSP